MKLSRAAIGAAAFFLGVPMPAIQHVSTPPIPGWRVRALSYRWSSEAAGFILYSQQAPTYWQAFYEGAAWARAADAAELLDE